MSEYRILRRKEVEQKTGLKTSSLYLKMKNNQFPQSVKLGIKSVGWLESEINDWLQERINLRVSR